MSRAVILAVGAVSAMGEGTEAASAGVLGERARVVIGPDPELERAGFARPFAARIPASHDGGDPATALLSRALGSCGRALDTAWPGWRSVRVGLALGTSAGGMRTAERFFDGLARPHASPPVDPEAATYFGPMAAAARGMGLPFAPSTLILGACASSTFALGLATRWLDAGDCDLVLAGGFDAVSVFVAAGFEVLRATSATVPPRPFRIGRDGMALGEGAVVFALTNASPDTERLARDPRAWVYLSGFGASADAVHLTAPDRTGSALARAAKAAIHEAGLDPETIDLVSAHATATPFNDPAEARALTSVFGSIRSERGPVVVPFKAQIGHTLGAAGGLEALTCVDALTRGVLPPSAGEGELDPEASVRLLDVTTPGNVRAALKLSSAFGGANAAIVLGRNPSAVSRPPRPVYVTRAVHVPEGAPEATMARLAERLAVPVDRITRVDPLTGFALAAVAKLAQTSAGRLFDAPSPAGAVGVIAGHAFATLETNAQFQTRIRERGARFAEPRRFPYTSPNAVAGECSILFGLTGPVFAVGSGLHGGLEALAVAASLVAAGDAEHMIVVAVDEIGVAARSLLGSKAAEWSSGAVATVITSRPWPGGFRIARTLLERGRPVPASTPAGHRALLPLVDGNGHLTLYAASPPDAFARVELEFCGSDGAA